MMFSSCHLHMLYAEDGYTPYDNDYVSGDALEGKIASSKPSIFCDPLVRL